MAENKVASEAAETAALQQGIREIRRRNEGKNVLTSKNVLSSDDFALAIGSSNKPLGFEVAELLGLPQHTPGKVHADASPYVDFGESVNLTGKELMIISTFAPGTQSADFVELLLMIDAGVRSDAQVSVTLTHNPFDRQDRKTGSNQAVGGVVILNALRAAGAKRINLFHPHSDTLASAVPMPVNIIPAGPVLFSRVIPYLNERAATNPSAHPSLDIRVAPDATEFKRVVLEQEREAQLYPNNPQPGLGYALKVRNPDPTSGKKVTSYGLVGLPDVTGLNALITDDLIAGGDTLGGVVKELKRRGAGWVGAAMAHGVFNKGVEKHILSPDLDMLFVTNSIDQSRMPAAWRHKVQVVHAAPLLAEAIMRTYTGEPMSEFYNRPINPPPTYV